MRLNLFAPSVYRGKKAVREPEMVAEFLGRTPGFFVEVGANEPIGGSQTWHLEQAGWDGLLVEPLHEHAENLRAQRKAKVAAVACGAPEHHNSFMTLTVAGPASTLAGKVIEPKYETTATRQVRVVTLDSLLDEHGVDRIDFLSIDVEGFEIEVLRGCSLERYRPRLVLLEDRVRNHRIHRYMTGRGYRLMRRTGLNAWYVPPGTAFDVSLFGRAQLLRKYYVAVPWRRLRHQMDRWRWRRG